MKSTILLLLFIISLPICAQINAPINHDEGFLVSVGGCAKNPGIKRVPATATLFDAIAAAGWSSELGSLKRVKVLRIQKDGSYQVTEYNLDNLISKGGKMPTLIQGDKIYIPQASWTGK